jgi:hypothetical protein
MVCLIGAHALGRCHTNASGYDGPVREFSSSLLCGAFH